jgi:hypothetical protein
MTFENILEAAVRDGAIPGAVLLARNKTGTHFHSLMGIEVTNISGTRKIQLF